LYLNGAFVESKVFRSSFNYTNLPVGNNIFTLVYPGNNNYTSVNSSLTVTATDAIFLKQSENPSGYGDSIGFYLQCSSSYMTTIDLLENGVSLGYQINCYTQESLFAIATLSVGTHVLEARFNGGSSYPSVSTYVTHVVTLAQSSIDFSYNETSYDVVIRILPGNFMGSIKGASGDLTFSLDGTLLEAVSIQNGYYERNTNSSLWDPETNHTVFITYSGNAYFIPANLTYIYEAPINTTGSIGTSSTTSGGFSEDSSEFDDSSFGHIIGKSPAVKLSVETWALFFVAVITLMVSMKSF